MKVKDFDNVNSEMKTEYIIWDESKTDILEDFTIINRELIEYFDKYKKYKNATIICVSVDKFTSLLRVQAYIRKERKNKAE